LSHVNVATLLDEQQSISHLSNKLIQTEICLIQPEFSLQDHRPEVFRCKFHHTGLDDWAVFLQSRIESFEVNKNVHQNVSEVCL
jgi:hypothetical protein